MLKWSSTSGLLVRQERSHVVGSARVSSDADSAIRYPGAKAAAVLIASLLLAIAGLLASASSAFADLPTTPDNFAQANGRVSTILRVGDTVYLGGSFTQLTNPDGTTVARNNLGAVDANTGRVTDWNPDANGSVRAMALSSDGTRLYLGGTFTNVGGQFRSRLAAVNLGSGAVDRLWSATTNDTVWTLAVSGNGVYAGGNFTTVKGQPRNHLAKLDATTGAVDPNWTPSADQVGGHYGSVRGLAFGDGGRLYVGGYFRSINGQPTGNLVALDPNTGAVDGGFQPNENNGIQSLAVSGGQVFVGTGDDLEGIEAFDSATGQLNWRLGYGSHASPEGDVQAIAVQGDTVYAGGHFTRMHDQLRNRLVAVDAATGTIDSQWAPRVSPEGLGVWAIATYGPRVYVGGDFASISGKPQTSLAQFTDGPDQPDRGLTGEYFDNMDFTGAKMTRIDQVVNYNWGNYSPPRIEGDTFSARWSGQVKAQYSETYTFYTTSDDGVRLWVNGQPVIDNWTDHAPTEDSGQVTLTGGQMHDIRMEYYENGGGAEARLSWSSARQVKQIVPQSRLYPATVAP